MMYDRCSEEVVAEDGEQTTCEKRRRISWTTRKDVDEVEEVEEKDEVDEEEEVEEEEQRLWSDLRSTSQRMSPRLEENNSCRWLCSTALTDSLVVSLLFCFSSFFSSFFFSSSSPLSNLTSEDKTFKI
jgi:hypothetical protein